jgi:hypothetical protein
MAKRSIVNGRNVTIRAEFDRNDGLVAERMVSEGFNVIKNQNLSVFPGISKNPNSTDGKDKWRPRNQIQSQCQ